MRGRRARDTAKGDAWAHAAAGVTVRTANSQRGNGVM